MFTSVSAFGVGYFLTRKDRPLWQRILVAVAAFALAWSLHFFWNSPFFDELGFAGQTVTHAIPVAIVGYLVWLLAGREEGRYLGSLADHYVGEDLITPEERRGLPSLRYRRSARQAVKKSHGRRAARALRTLQREQIRLVMYYGRHGAGPRLEDLEYAVRRARAQLETANSTSR